MMESTKFMGRAARPLPRLWPLAALLLLSACNGGRAAEAGGTAATARAALVDVGPFVAGPELWRDPRLAPHPAFGFATASHPPAVAELPPFWAPPPRPATAASDFGLEFLAGSPSEVRKSGGLEVFGSLAILSGFGDEGTIVDISNPAEPRFLGAVLNNRLRGAETIAYPDGRLLAVFATESDGLPVVDITDPRRPKPLYTLQPQQDQHNVGVVPGTPIVYNAGSLGGGNQPGGGNGYTEIWDLSDPDNPVQLESFLNGWGCHDISFWIDAAQDKYRAICAGVEFTQLWDIADPRQPEMIVNLPVHHGIPGTISTAVSPAIFSHFAGLNSDGTILYVGDETGGGAAPGCVAHVGLPPAAGVSFPSGAMFFYDVSSETQPLLQGWIAPASHLTVNRGSLSCTVHFGRLIPNDAGRDLMAIGAYGAGTLVLDFTNPTLPSIVSQYADATDTWEAIYHNGWIITGDLSKGLEVLALN